MSLIPYLYNKLPFDFTKDFEPVAPQHSVNYSITVTAGSKSKNLAGLMATAN